MSGGMEGRSEETKKEGKAGVSERSVTAQSYSHW